MRRQGGSEFQHTTFRMRQAQGPRMQMERIAKAFQMRGLPAIFAIAHDRAFKRLGAMHAQLMRAARERAQFQHRRLALRGIHHAIQRDSARALAIRDASYAFAALPAKLGKRQVNAAFQRMGAANHHGPIGFFRIPPAKSRRQSGSRRRRAPQDQNAGCVLVQPMHQARAFFITKAERIQHAIHMPRNPRPALHRQALRLINRNHGRIAVDHHAFKRGCIPV